MRSRRKTQYLQTPALERRTKRVIPGFRPVRSLLDAVGPSLLSATDLASRYTIEGEICRPLIHKRQVPRLLTARGRRCQFSVRIRSLIYSREKSFICHMVSTVVADCKVYARALIKVTDVHAMYLLTEWDGRMGNYLALGHGVWTERSEVRAP